MSCMPPDAAREIKLSKREDLQAMRLSVSTYPFLTNRKLCSLNVATKFPSHLDFSYLAHYD